MLKVIGFLVKKLNISFGASTIWRSIRSEDLCLTSERMPGS